MDPLIITCAGIGAELNREQQPALPLNADEIAVDAERVREAGAAVYHLHVRDAGGDPTMDVETFRTALEAIRARTDLIVQFTSGGAVGDSEEARRAPLALKPEMASLTTGTVNFGADVFWNPPGLIERLYRRMREVGVVPEFEIFEPGMIANADRIYDAFGDGHHRHYDFVLGVPGAMPAWEDSVSFLSGHLVEGSTWTATGIGRAHLFVTGEAIRLGGHVRTGFEDVRYFAPRELAVSNAQLVARVAEMSRKAGREPAPPDVAREILGL